MGTITAKDFGKLSSGESTKLFTLTNGNGCSVEVTDYGARLVSFILPDEKDIVLGYDNIQGYELGTCYMGATVGRNANRIAKGKFTLEGKEYNLYINNGPNHLHGGKIGFDRKIWHSEILADGVAFSYVSPDMEEGYPGNLKVQVIYQLTDDNALHIKYSAESDQTTLCNLTNHAYFNLAGAETGDFKTQQIAIAADGFTWADETAIPDGRIIPVEGTPMDLRNLVDIWAHIEDDYDELKFGNGYDHNWCLNNYDGSLRQVARVVEPNSKVEMEVYTTLPGMQFYTGNFLGADVLGKKGCKYTPRSGYALETQYYPNAINIPSFPQPILEAGKKWESETVYKVKF